jgi:ATPase subunit of ABC transporter with duplicated ATPase domains
MRTDNRTDNIEGKKTGVLREPGAARQEWAEKIFDHHNPPFAERKKTEKSQKEADKAARKELRKSREQWISAASAKAKEQKKCLQSIQQQLETGPKTVPEISLSAGIPSDQVLWFMSAMKKYGEIAEAGKDGSFYRYVLVQGASEKIGEE